MDYSDFRKQYETQHPASIPVRIPVASEYPRWLTPTAVLMFVASAFVSGLHTASAVHSTLTYTWTAVEQFKDVAAIGAFFGFELLLLLSMFAWLRSRGRRLAYVTTAVVFAVVLLTNVSDVARSASQDVIGALTIIGVGLGTPLVVLLSGKLLMDTYHSYRSAAQREAEDYRQARIEWDKTISAAWKKRQRDVGKVSPTVSHQDSESVPSELVRQYFRDNPAEIGTSVRDIADRLGVGHNTVHRVRKEFQANGHFSDDGNA